VPALIAHGGMCRRDARFATQERYTSLPDALHDEAKPARKPLEIVGPEDFPYDPVTRPCVGPAGTSLYCRGAGRRTRDHVGAHFRGGVIAAHVRSARSACARRRPRRCAMSCSSMGA